MTRTILPHRLPHALDERPDVTMLSLDCFDTLLWRDVHAPTDLFGELEGVTSGQRRRGEAAARKARVLAREASAEVTLAEIYDALLPHADAATRAAAVAHECAVEARHCYAFAPTVALMREAKRRGLRVVVVSDTYFTREQLAGLIRAAAGDEVAGLIDAIYCSSDHRSAKGEELFPAVLADSDVAPEQVLHIGDNPHADLAGAERHGITALHLVQFADATVQRLRQETVAGAMLAAGGTAFQPHRALVAAGEPTFASAEEVLGFGTLGPVLASFARWIDEEARSLAGTRGGKVHLLFLMRDGHLPREVFSAMFPEVATHAVEISRFAATAAAFRDAGAVRRFVLDEIGDGAGEALLRQLLIPAAEAKRILSALPKKDAARALADLLVSPAWLPVVTKRARGYADRLIAHVRRAANPAPGDTLILVDLGYNGTVQNRVAPVLEQAFGTAVVGRYLCLNETEPSGLDKAGMLDASLLDGGALEAFTSSIAVLEQFCTNAEGSVVDYRADGAPVRQAAGIKGRQSDVRSSVQAGCIAYAAHQPAMLRVAAPALMMHRRAAAATLARLLFLPLPHELQLMARFEHDANLGTDEKVALFDPAIAARGLRERGLFYLRDASRMYLPAELRGQGLPTSLALLAQRRFGLDLRYADFCDSEIAVPVLVADGTEAFADTVRATPTHDGWFVAAVPVGEARYTVGVQFGRLYDYVQIESARFLPVAAFLAGEASAERHALPSLPSAEGMEQVAPHLFRCHAPDAFLMVPPPEGARAGVPMMLTVVFRPIAVREEEPAVQPDEQMKGAMR